MPSYASLFPQTSNMISPKEAPHEPRRNALRLSTHPTPFNSEPSPQPQHDLSTDAFFNSKRGSQRDRHISAVPGSISPLVKRRTSRFGLSSFFGRSKPVVIEEVQERLGIPLEIDETMEIPMSANNAGPQRNLSQPISPLSQTLPEIDPPTAPLQNQTSKTGVRSKSSPRMDSSRSSSIAWEPPPLFQAYPQAIKHATLRAPTLSAETILRLNSERSSTSNQRADSYTPEVNITKFTKEKKLKRHTTLDLLAKGDWTDKIYVLLTSGYLLQYAGQGPFDRLPEKIMPLSKESVAFACDAIPGKPYVLQISQAFNEDGTLDREVSKSVFKNLGLRSQIKRSTSSFLLVFESPEDLSAWMKTVRKEIQAIGGKEYRPDEFQRPPEVEATQELHQDSSQQYGVKRDPSRCSQFPDLMSNVTLRDNTSSPESTTQGVDLADSAPSKRQSMATQQSVDSRTTSNTADSISQIHLDRLKESPRQSYASTAGKTTSTSRDSSPEPSPVNLPASVPQWAPSLNERRQTTSMYHGLVRNSVQQLTFPNKAHRESTITPTAPPSQPVTKHTPQQQRASSPAAPNFSVPTFSKRYSSASNVPALSCATPKPQIPPGSLIQAYPSPSVIAEEEEGAAKRGSIIGELQHHQKPGPKALNCLSASASTPPRSAGSCGPPSSSEGDRPFSRRFSSLDYSRGVSPLHLTNQSPSPHPPPTTALPAIPGPEHSSRNSLMKPPSIPLPPVPSAGGSRASSTTPTPPMALLAAPSVKTSPPTLVAPSTPPPTALPEMEPPHLAFCYPPPTKALPAVPVAHPQPPTSTLPSPPRTPSNEPKSHEVSDHSLTPQAKTPIPLTAESETPHSSPLIQSQTTPEPTTPNPPRARGSRRPVSMQVRSQTSPKYISPPQTASKTTLDYENIALPAESLPSPPRPTRNPPPPPSGQTAQPISGKSSPRFGREPPPVSALPSPRSTISVISPATNYFAEAAPHPFIPPIKVSERKFRGSLDGPWNPAYGAPQRNFFDLSAI